MSARMWTVLIAVLALTLIGGPALGYFSTSPAMVGVTITAAHEFPSDEDDDQEDDQDDDVEQVWICKLTGQPDDPQLAKQNNPRQVSGSAVDNGAFNDVHGSPVVEDGDVDCDDVWPPESTTVAEDGDSEDSQGNDEDDDMGDGGSENSVADNEEGDDSEIDEDENEEDGDDDGGDDDDEDEDDDL